MKLLRVSFESDWKVIHGSRHSQAAVMVIPAGKAEGGPKNTHASDQWLYIHKGKGLALVDGKRHVLKPKTLLFIKAGERHEIRNTGKKKLKTLNFYAPPAY